LRVLLPRPTADEGARATLEFGAKLADGLLEGDARRQAEAEDIGPMDGQRPDHQADLAARFMLASNVMIAAEAAAMSAAGAIEIEAWHKGAVPDTAKAAERGEQVRLLRDVFGNPFRPPSPIDPAWLAWNDGAVARLALAAYEERQLPSALLDPARLAVLADALEEAGCSDAGLLGHLRGEGPHVRGCWAVDQILGGG
jgi:hypothetical protein